MKKLKTTILLIGLTNLSYANNINIGYGQTSLFCPLTIECNSEDKNNCHLTNNPYDLWGIPKLEQTYSKNITGSYFFYSAIIREGFAQCKYINNQTHLSFLVEPKYPNSISFQNQIKPNSHWKKDNYHSECSSSNPGSTSISTYECPIVQSAGISIYDESPIKLFFPNPNAYFEANFITGKWLSYDQLYKRCGATSNCIIDIGICDGENENCTSYGSVELDISSPNIVKLNQIDSYKVPGNPYVFIQKQPFNIIQSTK